jgi:hypothetical protein
MLRRARRNSSARPMRGRAGGFETIHVERIDYRAMDKGRKTLVIINRRITGRATRADTRLHGHASLMVSAAVSFRTSRRVKREEGRASPLLFRV